MKIYWVNDLRNYDEYDDGSPRLHNVDFYATRELAEQVANERINVRRITWEKKERENAALKVINDKARETLKELGIRATLQYVPGPIEFRPMIHVDEIDVIEE